MCATQNANSLNHTGHEQIIVALAPLLERNHPTQQMCDFFAKVILTVVTVIYCQLNFCMILEEIDF